MQGYRGGNRRPNRIRYLIGLWFFCLPGWGIAQPRAESGMTWYVPKAAFHRGGVETSQMVEYSSLADLAEKLSSREGKPYHLTVRLEKTTAEDWQTLQRIASPTSLAVELADSVMSDALMPIMANWHRLERLEIRSLFMAGQYAKRGPTIAYSGKREAVITFKPVLTQLPRVGWEKLTSVKQVSLDDELDLQQAITVLQALPALETLRIQQFSFANKQNIAALAGLNRLKKLTLLGGADLPPAIFKGLTNLISLTVFNPVVDQLNQGLLYLTNLQELEIDCFPVSALRLGALATLRTLRIQQIPNRSALVANDPKVAAAAKRAMRSLDSTLTGLTTLQHVALEGMKLESFPASLLANKGLRSLSMPDADLTSLPDDLDKLGALEELLLDNNPLGQLPESVCRLPRLRRLSLSRCELTALPATIGQLTSLTSLAVNTNQLSSLPPSVGQLKQLRQLNVAMNQLTALPVELGTLPKLETIAAFWNKIARFPVGLTQVRELYLTDNQLTEPTVSLGKMKRLRSLLLDNNPLTTLPESIGQLDSLETLVLGNNQLTSLPKTIGSLHRLSRFTLGMNQIRELPETIGGLTSLTSVAVTDNPVARLPASIGNWLGVASVTIRLPLLESLPEQIGRWQALENLIVESDRMLALPANLTDCQQLTYLAVVGKRLIGLPESLGKLTHLTSLLMDGRADSLTGQGRGQVLALPASLANCKELTSLSILNQQQFDGVEGLQLAAKLPYLRHLVFINCGITGLDGVPWKSLAAATLNLSQNRISQLPPALLEMPNLEQANLTETNLPAQLNQFFLRRTQLAEAVKKQNE